MSSVIASPDGEVFATFFPGYNKEIKYMESLLVNPARESASIALEGGGAHALLKLAEEYFRGKGYAVSDVKPCPDWAREAICIQSGASLLTAGVLQGRRGSTEGLEIRTVRM